MSVAFRKRQKLRVLMATDHEGKPVMWRVCTHQIGFERYYPLQGRIGWLCYTRQEISKMVLTESERKALDDLQFRPYRRSGET